jgi:glycosyltransferase involved in cell wall biosynthesis
MHGDCSVSTKNLARQTGRKTVQPCKPEVAQRHSGYLVGGTSPFGVRKAMPVFVEASVLELERIYINGGRRGFLVSIAKYCSDTQKIRYFPSWAEDIFSQADLVPAPEVPVREGVFNVLFAGNIGEAQDLPAVLDAAELLKHNASIRWLIVGDGRKSDWLQEELERRDLQGSVLLLGRFPLERMPSFYAHADALLVSLKKDPVVSMTIPGKVQSYLMAGVPLVGMLDGGGAKVITEANAGLVCPAGDAGGLAAAVLEMAAMSVDRRHQLGVNGRAFAQREFGRGLLMDRLEALLHEAVSLYRQEKVKA